MNLAWHWMQSVGATAAAEDNRAALGYIAWVHDVPVTELREARQRRKDTLEAARRARQGR